MSSPDGGVANAYLASNTQTMRCSGSHFPAVRIRYRRIAATFSFFCHTVMESFFKSFTTAADRFRLWDMTLGAHFPVPSRCCNAYIAEANCWPHLQLITGQAVGSQVSKFLSFFLIVFLVYFFGFQVHRSAE